MTYEEIVEFVKANIKKSATKDIKNHIAVEFNIYGEGEGAFYIEVNDGVPTIEPYEYYDRDAKVIITADELVKIVNGEKSAEESVADGVTMVEGEVNGVLELLAAVKTPVKKTAEKKAAPSKKPAAKKTAKKVTKAEKEIVEMTKASKKSTVAKDIKK